MADPMLLYYDLLKSCIINQVFSFTGIE